MKYIIILMLLAILISLGTALYGLLRDKGSSNRTVKALTFRIGLSISLLILLLVAQYLGWIQPSKFTERYFEHQIELKQQKQQQKPD